jgi:hypothetical protein
VISRLLRLRINFVVNIRLSWRKRLGVYQFGHRFLRRKDKKYNTEEKKKGMGRPYNMPTGRFTPAGVPSSLLNGHIKSTRDNIHLFGRIMQERRDKEDYIKRWDTKRLTPWQIRAGARKII